MRDWEPFDDALRDAAADLPLSEETVQAVTPFRTAVRYVTAGLCLSFLTLNGWYLQYLLPALGTQNGIGSFHFFRGFCPSLLY